ncbi:MAG: aquaporin, partial [Phycisphaerae bacterium]|nr:aquaporin [Phycisphaerae bacterium]
MSPFASEFFGTAALVLIGNCASCSVLLARSRGENGGWLAVCAGWAFAMFVAVWIAVPSGAHLNPAVTVSMAATGELPAGTLWSHIAAQVLGACAGAALAALAFLPHWRLTSETARVQGSLFSPPSVRAPLANFFAVFLATFAYVFAVHAIIANPWQVPPGYIVQEVDAYAATGAWREQWWTFSSAVAIALGGVMLGMGGSSGGSINPARDIAGRAVHALLPLSGKGSTEWGLSWVP